MEHQRLWVSVFTAIIGLAVVAVIFSPRSQTGQVIGAAGGALGGLLSTAVSPITGAATSGYAPISAAPGPSNGGPSTSPNAFDPTQLVQYIPQVSSAIGMGGGIASILN